MGSMTALTVSKKGRKCVFRVEQDSCFNVSVFDRGADKGELPIELYVMNDPLLMECSHEGFEYEATFAIRSLCGNISN